MTFTSATIKKLQALHLTPEQFDAVLQIMEEAREVKKKGSVADRKARGSRLPEDWILPRAWGEYGLVVGLTEFEVRREAERFKNYWLSNTTTNAIKLNWLLTWKNWVIGAAEKLGRKPNPGAFGQDEIKPSGPSSYTKEIWERILRVWRLTNSWHPDHGPAPGQRGCFVPADLLQ